MWKPTWQLSAGILGPVNKGRPSPVLINARKALPAVVDWCLLGLFRFVMHGNIFRHLDAVLGAHASLSLLSWPQLCKKGQSENVTEDSSSCALWL